MVVCMYFSWYAVKISQMFSDSSYLKCATIGLVTYSLCCNFLVQNVCADMNAHLCLLKVLCALFTSSSLPLSCSPHDQIDTLRREREKLRKESASLIAQLNLKAARENRLMENYMRGQVSVCVLRCAWWRFLVHTYLSSCSVTLLST